MVTATSDLTRTERLLREQWVHLRTWLDELDVDALEAPSVLPGWRVADLVAHVGRAMTALTACQPAPPGAAPLSFARYVATYAGRAEEIDVATRELAAEVAADPLPALDAMAEDAFAQLGVLRALGPDPVVQARVGPILLSDMVLTRLTELVVHGDDLDRSLPHQPGDVVLDEALDTVAQGLLAVVVERGGWALEVAEPRAWVRVAAGRVAADAGALAAGIRPAYTSEGLPDLSAALPVL